jgi:hypothetical protein
MRRSAVLLLLVGLTMIGQVPASLLTAAPASAAVAARCRLVATVDGPELRIVYRLWDGGAREDWRVRFFRNGTRVYQRVHTTDGLGRFRVVRTYDNEPGPETILASATQVDTGVVCRVSVRV